MTTKVFHQPKKVSQEPVVLIAGDAGFVGFYLRELLLLKKCRVITIDNFLQPSGPEKENLKNIDGIDYIFHFAGFGTHIINETVNLLKLAQKTRAKFLFVSSSPNAEDLVRQSYQRGEVDARIVRLGFIYGPRMDLKIESELVLLIKEAIDGGPLRIAGDGSKKIYPSFVSDVVYGLSKAMFSSGTGGKIFSLVNPEKVTLISFAQKLKEQSRKPLTIEFVPEKKEKKDDYAVRLQSGLVNDHTRDVSENVWKSQADLGWKTKVGIEEGVRETLKYFEKKSEVGERELKFASPIKKKNLFSSLISRSALVLSIPKKSHKTSFPHFSYFILIFLLLFSLLFYPLASLGFDTFQGVRNLQKAQQDLLEVDFFQASEKARVAQRGFSQAKQKIQWASFFLDSFGLGKPRMRIEKLLTVGERVAGGVISAGSAARLTTQLAKVIFQDYPGDIESLLTNIKVDLDFAYDQLSLAEAEQKKEGDLSPVKIPFVEIRNLLLKAREGIEIVPEIVGIKGKRVYLVLLQNNMELRPTGGFIGSYALLTFTEGRLIDFEVEDVYTADGQLKGHVEPPEEIKKYLGEAGWYLRDSNWHPDFPASALRAEWFLEKETGRIVDGVLGVDLFFAQNILKQIGEIEVTDFQEKINYQNLFERAEYHSEAGFFSGSTQKKDFLASLSRALFEKIKTNGEKIWLSLGKAAYDSLKEKDFLVYLHNPEAMKVVSNLGWGGRIRGVECEEGVKSCLTDYLMIVEANVGVNKANYFVKRNLAHEVEIDQEGVIKEKLQIQYQNQSQSETFPAGRYKNYLRILVPKGTGLEEVKVDGKKLDEKKIVQSEVVDKKSFGFLVEVPIKEKLTVEVVYRLAEKIDFTKPIQYLLLLQKQPGIRDEVFNFSLTAPPEVSLLDAKPNASRSANTLIFSPKFNQDIVFEVKVIE